LQLLVLEVVSYHELKDVEELPVGDEAVPVHIVDLKGNWGGGERTKHRSSFTATARLAGHGLSGLTLQLLLTVTLGSKERDPADEFCTAQQRGCPVGYAGGRGIS
jgi:hypothetical protein